MEPALGIIAGSGPLPAQVARAAQAAGQRVFIIGLEGHAEPDLIAPFPHAFLRFGAAVRILSLLKEQGCKDLVLVGPVKRPSFRDMRPDGEGLKLLARIGKAAFMGDDGLLKAVIRVFSEEGFRVRGAHEILGGLIGRTGLMTRAAPDDQAQADIQRGVAVCRALGQADVGQGCVVQQGIVLAVEATEGTDAMLGRCGALAWSGPGGVLVKLVKPGQERRADLPTIGEQTVRGALAAGLRGIAFEAGGTLIIERDQMVAAADAAGFFVIGLGPEALNARPLSARN
ncbi:UDP-2,3-diacylglucosamine diphosphatase LpxI [Acidisoma cellulosilytica]|uniref:UDP-2,3-diacylglucosamine diphosphatase LpxI n=1 Tax=Acidisoma cellulosilyticum TaxID=2802395 RepID=A0A964E3I9_9PROT|nr:UDP-2,3-diacylglucosamine diphosphatase LpxI [Acidisoma cellulosilyticum]MCB8880469.1 UDP-2,3-diacylglucosamine diphosphatase LpxI [Acidisoma cellulosilyticum]